MAETFTGPSATLAYARHGRPGGSPVLVHHGLIGSTGVDPDWAALAEERDLELIAVARPGYGRSTPVLMARIAEWADLVEPLLDHLGVGEYTVLGISAGAPYAYCLAARHGGRVRGAAIASGLGHLCDPHLVALYPPASREAFAHFRSASQEEVADYWRVSLESSRAALPEGHRWTGALDDSLAHGAAGPGREARLQQEPWGFDLGEISCPVRLWHAPADTMAPYEVAERTARLIPDAVLLDQTDPDHVPSTETARAALDFLAARGR